MGFHYDGNNPSTHRHSSPTLAFTRSPQVVVLGLGKYSDRLAKATEAFLPGSVVQNDRVWKGNERLVASLKELDRQAEVLGPGFDSIATNEHIEPCSSFCLHHAI